jgi:hypothetical protein
MEGCFSRSSLDGSDGSDGSGSGTFTRGGVETSDCGALSAAARSIDTEVFGVPVGTEFVVSWDFVGLRAGESGVRAELRLSAAIDLRGETLRPLFRRIDPVESKLPCEMLCRHVMMRSFGGCVDTLSLLDRLVRDRMLLGRPFLDDVSQVSLSRTRLSYAQSCLNTFNDPL